MKQALCAMSLLIFLATTFVRTSAARPQPRTHNMRISCLTEVRAGKKSCWGIVIRFAEGRFKKTIRANQLKVYEAKHGANILDLMMWETSRDRKQLTIKFKPGDGDFGTGNRVAVTLYKTAFASAPNKFPPHVVIVKNTDVY
jgi:hypothetical protein